MTVTLEEVQALGFKSIEDCEKHQVFLANQRRIASECHTAYLEAERTGSNIIDLTKVNWT